VKEDIKHLHEKVRFFSPLHTSIVSNMFYLVQDSIPFLRSLSHVADAGSTYCRSYHLGSTNRTTTSDIHETSRRCVRKGMGGEHYAEGQKLQSESNAFPKKLDTYLVFQAWLQDISGRNMGVDGRLFEIVRLRGSRKITWFCMRISCMTRMGLSIILPPHELLLHPLITSSFICYGLVKFCRQRHVHALFRHRHRPPWPSSNEL